MTAPASSFPATPAPLAVVTTSPTSSADPKDSVPASPVVATEFKSVDADAAEVLANFFSFHQVSPRECAERGRVFQFKRRMAFFEREKPSKVDKPAVLPVTQYNQLEVKYHEYIPSYHLGIIKSN